jgi:large-conductance mechanosensitive channel
MVCVENQVLMFAIAIHAGLVLTKFFEALARDLVLPLLAPVSTSEGGISKWVIQVGAAKFNVGDVIVQTINMFVAFMVVYLTLPYLKEYVPIAGRR